jgi:hypothetical protein
MEFVKIINVYAMTHSQVQIVQLKNVLMIATVMVSVKMENVTVTRVSWVLIVASSYVKMNVIIKVAAITENVNV